MGAGRAQALRTLAAQLQPLARPKSAERLPVALERRESSVDSCAQQLANRAQQCQRCSPSNSLACPLIEARRNCLAEPSGAEIRLSPAVNQRAANQLAELIKGRARRKKRPGRDEAVDCVSGSSARLIKSRPAARPGRPIQSARPAMGHTKRPHPLYADDGRPLTSGACRPASCADRVARSLPSFRARRLSVITTRPADWLAAENKQVALGWRRLLCGRQAQAARPTLVGRAGRPSIFVSAGRRRRRRRRR